MIKEMEDTTPKSNGYGKRPLWQWVVLYVILGIIVYGLIYYFFFAKKGGYNYNQTGNQYPTTQQVTTRPSVSPSSSQTATPSTTTQQHLVTLTPNGFSPTNLTIKAGSTVTWTNNSGQPATVNSDPHPTHTDYPPLNLGQFANGGTLSLTFTKPGTYGYHNHLNPSERGSIIVQ